MLTSRFRLAMLFLTTALYSQVAKSQVSSEGKEAILSWFDFLAQVNRYSPLEGAYSHGSMGFVVGAGGSRHELASNSDVSKVELGLKGDEEKANVELPAVWGVIGLPWPVDIGASAAKMPGHDLSLLSGHVQWTVFEALAMPAVAVRGSFGQVFGLRNTRFTTKGVDLVASYGFLRYFTVYGAYGIADHYAAINIDADSDYSFMLAGTGTAEEVTRQNRDSSFLYGLRVTILPPFVALTAESQSSNDGTKHYAAKLSVWL